MRYKHTLSLLSLRMLAVVLSISAFTTVSSKIVMAFSPCACCDQSYGSCSETADQQLMTSSESCAGFYEVNGPEQCFDGVTAGTAERGFECSNCYESGWNNYQSLLQQCSTDWWNCSDDCTGWGQGAVN